MLSIVRALEEGNEKRSEIETVGVHAEETGYGVLVVNARLRLLFMNQRAATFLSRLKNGQTGDSPFPQKIVDFGNEVSQRLVSEDEPGLRRRFAMVRVLEDMVHPLAVRIMGLPDLPVQHQLRIVMLFEELATRSGDDTDGCDMGGL
ncbi:MAG: hypothetical protein ACT4OO_13285 [Nitrospiraceae bacterium]